MKKCAQASRLPFGQKVTMIRPLVQYAVTQLLASSLETIIWIYSRRKTDVYYFDQMCGFSASSMKAIQLAAFLT
jgi:UTP-glucose-1-phosphate uridylyltransferase